jgi:UDPglucose 6-dehydrogenase
MGKEHGAELNVVGAVDRTNNAQKAILLPRLSEHLGGLKDKVVAVWGIAFKPRTDDIREAPALTLIDKLLAAGARVIAHDPAAMDNVKAIYGDKVTMVAGMYDACIGADALVLVTEWHEYRNPDFARMHKAMRGHVLIDGRNQWPLADLRARGFAVQAIGRV